MVGLIFTKFRPRYSRKYSRKYFKSILEQIFASQFEGRAKELALREKCPYSEFFWSVFSRIWTKYTEILRMRKTRNTDTFQVVYVGWLAIDTCYDFIFLIGAKNQYFKSCLIFSRPFPFWKALLSSLLNKELNSENDQFLEWYDSK